MITRKVVISLSHEHSDSTTEPTPSSIEREKTTPDAAERDATGERPKKWEVYDVVPFTISIDNLFIAFHVT